jgi:hypothetical protein
MEAIGLMPSDTGEPGGGRVGQRVSHYIIEGGPFDCAFHALPTNWLLPFTSAPVAKKDKTKTDRSKTAFVCAGCGAKAWGKPDLWIACIDCDLQMVVEG